MNTEKEIRTYLFDKGDLHDCPVDRIVYSPTSAQVSIFIEDINAGFHGLPEYPGLEPECLTFTEVSAFQFDVVPADSRLSVYETALVVNGDTMSLEIRFWPGGKLTVSFAAMSLGRVNNREEDGWQPIDGSRP